LLRRGDALVLPLLRSVQLFNRAHAPTKISEHATKALENDDTACVATVVGLPSQHDDLIDFKRLTKIRAARPVLFSDTVAALSPQLIASAIHAFGARQRAQPLLALHTYLRARAHGVAVQSDIRVAANLTYTLARTQRPRVALYIHDEARRHERQSPHAYHSRLLARSLFAICAHNNAVASLASKAYADEIARQNEFKQLSSAKHPVSSFPKHRDFLSLMFAAKKSGDSVFATTILRDALQAKIESLPIYTGFLLANANAIKAELGLLRRSLQEARRNTPYDNVARGDDDAYQYSFMARFGVVLDRVLDGATVVADSTQQRDQLLQQSLRQYGESELEALTQRWNLTEVEREDVLARVLWVARVVGQCQGAYARAMALPHKGFSDGRFVSLMIGMIYVYTDAMLIKPAMELHDELQQKFDVRLLPPTVTNRLIVLASHYARSDSADELFQEATQHCDGDADFRIYRAFLQSCIVARRFTHISKHLLPLVAQRPDLQNAFAPLIALMLRVADEYDRDSAAALRAELRSMQLPADVFDAAVHNPHPTLDDILHIEFDE